MIVKRVKRQASARGVFNPTDRVEKATAKSKSLQKVTTMLMAIKEEEEDQQGKKRKGKVGTRPKETSSSPLRRTRSRTLGFSKDRDNFNSGTPVENSRSSKQQAELGNRKRGRETIPPTAPPTAKKPSATISPSGSSPNLAKITEDKSAFAAEEDEAAASSVNPNTNPPPGPVHGAPRPGGIASRKKVTTVQRKSVAKELQKRTLRERKTVKKAGKKVSSPSLTTRSKMTPLPGLQELRTSTNENSEKLKRPATKLGAAESRDEPKGMLAAQESSIEEVRVTRSRNATKALKGAEDAAGFVRTTMNAVAQARMKEEQQQRLKRSVVDISAPETITKDETQAHRSRSSKCKGSARSTRSKTSLTAEKLIQELDSFRLASGRGKPGESDMKEKLRKGINRLTKSRAGSSAQATPEKKLSTKLPRVANQENLPKATASALVRRMKGDIEDHAKKYGLVEQEKPALPGRGGVKGPRSSGGLEQRHYSGRCDEYQSPNDWTAEQEMALRHAYISVKPAQDFWYHISKRVPGKTADECFHKFYAEHPTPRPARKQKRQIDVDAAADDSDSLAVLKPKRRAGKSKQRLLEAHRTIRNILRKQQVEDEEYEADAFVALEHPDVVDSVLNSEEANEAVIFQASEIPTCPSPTTSQSKASSISKPFEHIVIGGLLTNDKENRNVNAAESRKGRILLDSQAHLSSPEVLKKVKNPTQLDKYIDHLHQRHSARRPRTGSEKPVKKSNVYLHSKEALDFGENTLGAIQRAKEELRNVFLKSGVTGASLLEIVSAGEEEGEDGEEHEGECSSDGDG